MTLSKRTALGVSLAVIVLYWIYQIASQWSHPFQPRQFSELVLRVVCTKLIVLAVLVLLLRLEGEGFGALGVSRREWPKHVAVGLAFGFGMFVVLNVALNSVLISLFPRPPASGPSILSFFEPAGNLLLWIPIGILGGGVVEELQRIFVLTRFEKWGGGSGLVLAVVLSSVMFGVGHLYQGVGSAISSAVSGALFALVYLRRRSALEPIVAHASSDVLAVVAATLLAR